MHDLQGLKELYDVTIKSTYPMEMGKRKIEEGEIILSFDNIQIGGLQEVKARTDARGGFDNRSWVYWETTKEMPISFTQGVFSIEHLSLISNSKMYEINEDTTSVILTQREKLESSEFGEIELKRVPMKNIFVYDKETGEKIDYIAVPNQNKLVIEKPFLDVYVTYEWAYQNGGQVINIGRRLLNGYLKLNAKTKIKEDVNGITRTGIIEIPKLKLMSDLSIRLGRKADPAVVSFNAIGVPVGARGASYVCSCIFLNDDIDF